MEELTEGSIEQIHEKVCGSSENKKKVEGCFQ